MLKLNYSKFKLECGTDEAGRGCLAGPVTAAAVIMTSWGEKKTIMMIIIDSCCYCYRDCAAGC